MKVKYSRLALADLEAIWAYLESENPVAAVRFSQRLESIVARLARFPKAAAEIVERPGVRRVPLIRYPYAIYYKIVIGEVVILRIVHGARRDPWKSS
jgi:plasmid stabilization system protein ParE